MTQKPVASSPWQPPLDEARRLLDADQPGAAHALIQQLDPQAREDLHVMNFLSYFHIRTGQIDQAIEWTGRLIERAPQTPGNLSVYVRLLLQDKRCEQAVGITRRGLERWPGDELLVEQHAGALCMLGRYGEACRVMDAAFAGPDPPRLEALRLRYARVLSLMGRDGEARPVLEGLDPGQPGWQLAWLEHLAGSGQRDQALEMAGRLRQDGAPALDAGQTLSLARVLTALGQHAEALGLLASSFGPAPDKIFLDQYFLIFQQLTVPEMGPTLQRDFPRPGTATLQICCSIWSLRTVGRGFEAWKMADQAMEASPQTLELIALRAFTGTAVGETHKAREDLANLEQFGIDQILPYAANIWFSWQFAQGVEWQGFARMLRKLDPFARFDQHACLNARTPTDPDRCLRIGIMGSEFRRHAMAFTAWAWFDVPDPERFSLVVYDNSPHHDAWTSGFRRQASLWRDVRALSDQKLAQTIAEDGIDILVDLPTHTSGNRLPVFQYKAAPLQLSWMHPTLVGSIGHLIADRAYMPEGFAADLLPRATWYLPSGALPYSPIAAADLPPPRDPVPEPGAVRFGNCNAGHKLSRQAIRLYTQLLRRLPRATLLLANSALGTETGRAFQLQRFREEGLEDPDRLILMPFVSDLEYLHRYAEIDICLDSVPSGGGITSWDALWMGRPVVTLAGQGATFSRNTSSVLQAIGREEWIADTEEAWLRIACDLAARPQDLAALAPVLRRQVLDAPVNRGAFSREVYAILRAMWWEWCAHQQAEAWMAPGNPTWRREFARHAGKLQDDPGNRESLNILMRILSALGRNAEAAAFGERNLGLGPFPHPDHAWRTFMCRTCAPGYSWPELCREARHTARLTRHPDPVRSHPNLPDPERRLRIGYVATDLSVHALGCTAMALVRGIDRDRFACHIYCDLPTEDQDEFTAWYRSQADGWRDYASLTDAQTVACIQEDGIDILVDLENHRISSRHGVFAARPAPLQASWMHPVAIESVAHVITDGVIIPPGWEAAIAPVQVWRMADGAIPCNRMMHQGGPPAQWPFERHGVSTLGLIGMGYKLSPEFLAMIGRVLQRLPRVHLVMRNQLMDSQPGIEMIAQHLDRQGIARERIRFLERTHARDYYATYGEIDVFADPFPRSGAVSVWDALGMGVPVVTLAGDGWSYTRNGASVLTGVGLSDWVVHSVAEYEEKLVELLSGPEVLRPVRADLPRRVAEAPVCKGDSYIRALEQIYRRMWRAYCAGQDPAA